MVSPREPTSPLRAESSRTPQAKVRPPGACRRAPGLAPEEGPCNLSPGKGDTVPFLFFSLEVFLGYVLSGPSPRTCLPWEALLGALSLRQLGYSGVLEWRVCRDVKPPIQEDLEQWTSSTPSAGSSGVRGRLPNQSTCVLWIWRRLLTASLGKSCGWSPSLVRIVGSKLDSFPVRAGLRYCSPLSPILLTRDLQLSLHWFAAECKAAGIRFSTSKSEAMALGRKKMECLLWVGEKVLP